MPYIMPYVVQMKSPCAKHYVNNVTVQWQELLSQDEQEFVIYPALSAREYTVLSWRVPDSFFPNMKTPQR